MGGSIPPSLTVRSETPKAFGVSDLTVKLGGMLPPIVSDCNAEGQTRLHIGDLKVDISMNVLGSPLNAEVFVSLESGFSFSVSDAGLHQTR